MSFRAPARFDAYLWAVVVSVITLVLAAKPIADWMQDAASDSWPSVPGVVVRHDSNYYPRSSRSTSPWPRIKVTYEYVVDRTAHQSDRYSLHALLHYPSDSTPSRNSSDLSKLPAIGATLKVYYDPADPSFACLRPGYYLSENLSLLITAPLVLIFAFGSALSWRHAFTWRPEETKRERRRRLNLCLQCGAPLKGHLPSAPCPRCQAKPSDTSAE